MKKAASLFRLKIICFLIITTLCVNAQDNSAKPQNQQSIFPKGQKAPQANFTGAVWVHGLVTADSAFNIPVASVSFEPGAKTNRVGGPMAYPRRRTSADRY